MVVYYRGTKKGDKRRIKTGVKAWDNNLFCSKLEEKARWYGPDIEIVTSKPKAKVITEGTKEFEKIFGKIKENQNLLEWGVFVITKAKELGYQIVEFKRQGDMGTVIMDEKAVIRNAITEKDIESYMEQFKVDRETAVIEIAEALLIYYEESERQTEKTYRNIIKDSYPL